MPDRVYMERVLLPMVARRGGDVLLVGCRHYTARDPHFLQRRGVRCWTLDIDPEAAKWGAPDRHVVSPIEQAAFCFGSSVFSTVLLNGVIGWGLDERPAQEMAISACATVLKPGGLLVVGWNTDRSRDPSSLSRIRQDFQPMGAAALGRRVNFRSSSHVFDFYTRSASGGADH